jgi:steroid delta-isomerase-like uncharacterized protein
MGASRDVIERYFAASEHGEVDTALATFAPGAEFMGPMGSLPFPEGVRTFLGSFASSFPNARFEVHHVIEAGDEVVVEGEWVGTHTGPLPLPDGSTLPATANKVRAPFVTLFRVHEGQITSHRAYWDMAGFMAQLGLGPQ